MRWNNLLYDKYWHDSSNYDFVFLKYFDGSLKLTVFLVYFFTEQLEFVLDQ